MRLAAIRSRTHVSISDSTQAHDRSVKKRELKMSIRKKEKASKKKKGNAVITDEQIAEKK